MFQEPRDNPSAVTEAKMPIPGRTRLPKKGFHGEGFSADDRCCDVVKTNASESFSLIKYSGFIFHQSINKLLVWGN